MKCLIIRDPHCERVLAGSKNWEMRSSKTKVRGRIGIIKAGTGMIWGEADLVGCGEPIGDAIEAQSTYDLHRVDDFTLLEKWRFPWILENAQKYDTPKPYTHPSGAVIWVNTPD